MTISAYVKVDGEILELPATGASTTGVTVEKQVTTLTETLTAGTPFSVPVHTVGSGRLSVYIDGLLCLEGADEQYLDSAASLISFNDDLAAGTEIVAVAIVTGDITADLTSVVESVNLKLDSLVYEAEKTEALNG